MNDHPEHSPLGKKSEYDSIYNPDKLFAIPRKIKRNEIGIDDNLIPFYGYDCWNHYEVSWLNKKGKPIVATAEIIYGCDSPNMIESKSMKLYFNSFNNTQFENKSIVEFIIKKDLEKNVGREVFVKITTSDFFNNESLEKFSGICIDHLDISCDTYTVNSDFLMTENKKVEETIYSDLLKSNCLVTNQPDWGSVKIAYSGNKINHEGLLKYIVSLRNHNEFHEQCVERIFVDIMQKCKPKVLTVHGRYTRRGGLDINPFRTTLNTDVINLNKRLYRQ